MMYNILYRLLGIADMHPNMLDRFNRYQKVTKCWRKKSGEWVLTDVPFVENWNASEKRHIIEQLAEDINSGGFVIGAFDDETLIGFASVNARLIGSRKQYAQLSNLHISYEYRGKGIGKKLFDMTVSEARRIEVESLYVSAHSSMETQAFYRGLGCEYTDEIVPELFEAEPYDVHLQYRL